MQYVGDSKKTRSDLLEAIGFNEEHTNLNKRFVCRTQRLVDQFAEDYKRDPELKMAANRVCRVLVDVDEWTRSDTDNNVDEELMHFLDVRNGGAWDDFVNKIENDQASERRAIASSFDDDDEDILDQFKLDLVDQGPALKSTPRHRRRKSMGSLRAPQARASSVHHTAGPKPALSRVLSGDRRFVESLGLLQHQARERGAP
jgi:hypothetical protein